MARDADGKAIAKMKVLTPADVARARAINEQLQKPKFLRRQGKKHPGPQMGQISVETRGRRSLSQKTRDTSEMLRSIGLFGDSAPKWLDALAGLSIVGGLVWSVSPHINIYYSNNANSPARWDGAPVDRIELTYPNRWLAKNVSILASVLMTRDADLGGLLALGGTALVFTQIIDKTFPNPNEHDPKFMPTGIYPAYDLAFGPQGVKPGGGGLPQEVKATFYLKVIVPKYLLAIVVASIFYIIFRGTTALTTGR